VFAPQMQSFMQMKDRVCTNQSTVLCFCTNHRSSAGAAGGGLPLWLG
jgi:hypothetical protein